VRGESEPLRMILMSLLNAARCANSVYMVAIFYTGSLDDYTSYELQRKIWKARKKVNF